MRRAYNNVEFVETDNSFIGVSLGYDYCAEHEWGIDGIKSRLGIPLILTPDNAGLMFRTVSKFDEKNFTFFKTKKTVNKKVYHFAGLIMSNIWNDYAPENLPHGLTDYQKIMAPNGFTKEGKKIITAWNEKEFGIIVIDKENITKLEELYEAFKQKNVCIGLFGGGAFANAHLTIAIKDRMPIEIDEAIKKNDIKLIEEAKLKEEWKEKVTKAGKKFLIDYSSISPKFFDFYNPENEKEKMEYNKTNYRFNIWINGCNDNCGWYTVEQIENWLKSDKEIKEFKNKSND